MHKYSNDDDDDTTGAASQPHVSKSKHRDKGKQRQEDINATPPDSPTSNAGDTSL